MRNKSRYITRDIALIVEYIERSDAALSLERNKYKVFEAVAVELSKISKSRNWKEGAVRGVYYERFGAGKELAAAIKKLYAKIKRAERVREVSFRLRPVQVQVDDDENLELLSIKDTKLRGRIYLKATREYLKESQ